ncbi:uncharacterized protein LOC116304290 [Actinia tenebrosa]|uniref:Uncharacterized protein LOC116304290 n=1 Tax=Actinia tenebrosa TaxID=6105 RepID=A0A6P8IUM2_ACTTE|nr:uncharacterized protein LOC116304290 [Actinia tenebrosa]
MKQASIIYLVVLLVFLSSDLVTNKVDGTCNISITIQGGPVILVNEGQTTFPVTFLRTGNSTAVTVNARTNSGTAKEGSDFNSSTETIPFALNVNNVTVTFTILNNMKLENHNESFFINVTSSDPSVCTDSVIIQIKDDDKVTIGFHDEFIPVRENIGNVTMKFFKSPTGSTEISLTARYFTKGIGNATKNKDYQNVNKYITFTSLQYTKTETDAVAIIDNDIVEYTKCFNISMDATHPNVITSRQSMICILNDDKVTIEFRHSNLSVEEDLGYISVPIIKTGKSAIPISVRMTMNVEYNTAIKNVDYEEPRDKIITFPKDVSEMIFNVTIKNDDDFESTESFFVGIEVVDSSTTAIGTKGVSIIRITDRIDNEIHQERQRQIEEEQKRRALSLTYLLYVIVAVLIVMIIIFIVLIVMLIKKMRKFNKDRT